MESSLLQDHEFVCVGGMHRSGTTYLADSIAGGDGATALSNSGVHMGEGQFLQDVFPVEIPAGRLSQLALHHRDRESARDRAKAYL